MLASAARLQSVVPEAVLVGGAAAAWYAGHRTSFVHDHVLTDLNERYASVLEAVEATEGWVTSVRASSPPLTRLGSAAVDTLVGIDDYYVDRSGEPDSVLTVVVQRLSEPNPRDERVTSQLTSYKGLEPRWQAWADVVAAARSLADAIVVRLEGER